MKITNKLGLPQALVAAVANDPYDPGSCDITVTRLISPPRKVALEAQHAKEISEDVSDRLWALFGQAVHHILERGDQEAVTEERLSIERQGWVISGKFDRLVVADGVLQEYKVTTASNARNGGREEWIAQMNILATILRENGYPISRLEVIMILRDWNRHFVSKTSDYPAQQVMRVELPLWSEEDCECFIDECIRNHQNARKVLPLCTPEECWSTPDSFALCKEGRKSAIKVYNDKSDAYAALEVAGPGKFFVEHRPGRNLRCENYCPAATFCTQWQALQAPQEDKDVEDPKDVPNVAA